MNIELNNGKQQKKNNLHLKRQLLYSYNVMCASFDKSEYFFRRTSHFFVVLRKGLC